MLQHLGGQAGCEILERRDLAKLDGEMRGEAARLSKEKAPEALVGEIAAERYEPDAARKEAEWKIIPGLWEWMIHARTSEVGVLHEECLRHGSR
jgi:hypothetical protein